MRKNLHDRILKGKSKKQYLSIVLKSCPYKYILGCNYVTLDEIFFNNSNINPFKFFYYLFIYLFAKN